MRAALDHLSDSDIETREVAVASAEPVAVIHVYDAPISRLPSRNHDYAISGCAHGRAERSADVLSFVEFRRHATKRVAAAVVRLGLRDGLLALAATLLTIEVGRTNRLRSGAGSASVASEMMIGSVSSRRVRPSVSVVVVTGRV